MDENYKINNGHNRYRNLHKPYVVRDQIIIELDEHGNTKPVNKNKNKFYFSSHYYLNSNENFTDRIISVGLTGLEMATTASVVHNTSRCLLGYMVNKEVSKADLMVLRNRAILFLGVKLISGSLKKLDKKNKNLY